MGNRRPRQVYRRCVAPTPLLRARTPALSSFGNIDRRPRRHKCQSLPGTLCCRLIPISSMQPIPEKNITTLSSTNIRRAAQGYQCRYRKGYDTVAHLTQVVNQAQPRARPDGYMATLSTSGTCGEDILEMGSPAKSPAKPTTAVRHVDL